MDHLIAFLGWSTVIHFAALWLSMAFMHWGLPLMGGWYGRWTGISEPRLRELMFQALVLYKTLIWTLFAVPYGVLKWLL
jgi:hypothetical protein